MTALTALPLRAGTQLVCVSAEHFEALTAHHALSVSAVPIGWAALHQALALPNSGADLRFYAIESRWPEQTHARPGQTHARPGQAHAAIALGFAQIDLQGARLLLAESSLPLSDAHFQQVLACLRGYLEEEGIKLVVHAGQRMSLELPAAPSPFSAPPQAPWLDAALGSRLGQILPAPMAWARLQNELQMALAQLPLQSERANSGLPNLNCVWLWGGGAEPGVARSAPALSLILANGTPNTSFEHALLAAFSLASEGSDASAPPVRLWDFRAPVANATLLIEEISTQLQLDAKQPRLLWCLDGRAACVPAARPWWQFWRQPRFS